MKVSSQKPVYAFIDSQNLNLGIQHQGWRLDFKKFRLYLKNKYGVDKAFIFIGMVPGNEALYSRLSAMGYVLVFKQTVGYMSKNQLVHKGNVDSELVLNASAIHFNEYAEAVVVSGDGDFRCLYDFLIEKGKLRRIICPTHKYSSLLREISEYVDVLGSARKSLEHIIKSDQHQRSVETLGLSGHGDNSIITKQKNIVHKHTKKVKNR